MRVIFQIGIALFFLGVVIELVLFNFGKQVTAITSISLGLLLLTVLLFGYVLVDCRRRSEANFPTLIWVEGYGLSYGYEGKVVISQRSMRKIWTWILILSFILGLPASQRIWSGSETWTNTPPPGSVESTHQFTSPFFTYKVHQVGDQENREIILRIPLFFLIGLYLYYRGVVRQPKGQE